MSVGNGERECGIIIPKVALYLEYACEKKFVLDACIWYQHETVELAPDLGLVS